VPSFLTVATNLSPRRTTSSARVRPNPVDVPVINQTFDIEIVLSLFSCLQYSLQFASKDTILSLDQQVKAEMLAISLMLVA